MLSGTLPFDSDDDREIARKTIYDDVNMHHHVWTKVSDDAKDLVLCNQYKIFNIIDVSNIII